MAPLTVEFSEATVETFLPLVRHDLGLRPEEQIELTSVAAYRESEPERYRLAPAVKAFERKLEIGRN